MAMIGQQGDSAASAVLVDEFFAEGVDFLEAFYQPLPAFAGADGEITFDLNPDFELGRMNAQEQAQIVTSWQANAITTSEMRAKMKSAGIATLDDEEYAAEVEAKKPDYGTGLFGGLNLPPEAEETTAEEEAATEERQ